MLSNYFLIGKCLSLIEKFLSKSKKYLAQFYLLSLLPESESAKLVVMVVMVMIIIVVMLVMVIMVISSARKNRTNGRDRTDRSDI